MSEARTRILADIRHALGREAPAAGRAAARRLRHVSS